MYAATRTSTSFAVRCSKSSAVRTRPTRRFSPPVSARATPPNGLRSMHAWSSSLAHGEGANHDRGGATPKTERVFWELAAELMG